VYQNQVWYNARLPVCACIDELGRACFERRSSIRSRLTACGKLLEFIEHASFVTIPTMKHTKYSHLDSRGTALFRGAAKSPCKSLEIPLQGPRNFAGLEKLYRS